jgi:hypothetical protein
LISLIVSVTAALLVAETAAFSPSCKFGRIPAARTWGYGDCGVCQAKEDADQEEAGASGLYKQFSDHAWEKLQDSGLFQAASLPLDLQRNQAPAKGMKDSIVKISTKAMIPTADSQGLVRYARVALLETVSESSTETIQSAGIQVLNFVVIPSDSTSLPVLGIDLVTLPGNKHLLLLDAQPMTQPNPFQEDWQEWHSSYVNDNPNFPWGGDFPEPVQQYISKYALWTRLQELENPVSVIQNQVWDAFVAHLDVYLDLLKKHSSNSGSIQGSNHQPAYLEYRRTNDPAKPMLNSLYGAEWTERVLDEVLFPQD